MVRPTKMRNRQIYRASQALRSKQVSANLSKGLRSKYGRRSIRVVEGDTVMIKRGEYADVPGKVEKIDIASGRISVAGVKKEKAKGDKFDVMMHASNVLVTGLNLSDQRRRDKIGATGEYETDETANGSGAGDAAAATIDDTADAGRLQAETPEGVEAGAESPDGAQIRKERIPIDYGDVEAGAESPDGAEATQDETDGDVQAVGDQDTGTDANTGGATDGSEESEGGDNEGGDAADGDRNMDQGGDAADGDRNMDQGGDGGQADKAKQNRPGNEA